MNRRAFLRSAGVAAAAAPVLTVRELARPEPAVDLPRVVAGQRLTAETWNQLVARVNELSRVTR